MRLLSWKQRGAGESKVIGSREILTAAPSDLFYLFTYLLLNSPHPHSTAQTPPFLRHSGLLPLRGSLHLLLFLHESSSPSSSKLFSSYTSSKVRLTRELPARSGLPTSQDFPFLTIIQGHDSMHQSHLLVRRVPGTDACFLPFTTVTWEPSSESSTKLNQWFA